MRTSAFAIELDAIDREIATWIKKRDDLVSRQPADYDCDGEGEVYFDLISEDHAEACYHAVAKIE